MKTSPKKWRLARHTDDGCTVYQCLSCKSEWEARTNPEWSRWVFCPYCGIKWEGKHECLTKYEKRYELERKWQDSPLGQIPKPHRIELLYRVQERWSDLGDDPGAWSPADIVGVNWGEDGIGAHPKWDEWSQSHREARVAVWMLKQHRKQDAIARAKEPQCLHRDFRIAVFRYDADGGFFSASRDGDLIATIR